MNGPLAQAESKAFATRLLAEAGADDRLLVDRAWRLALGGPPRQSEADAAVKFLREQTKLLGARPAAVADFCLALINLNAFVYLD